MSIKDAAKDGMSKMGDDVTSDTSSSKNDKKNNNTQNKSADNKNSGQQNSSGKNTNGGKTSSQSNDNGSNGRFGAGIKKGDVVKDVVNDITSDPRDNDDNNKRDNRPVKNANKLGKQAVKGIAASKALGGIKGALAGLLLKGGLLGLLKNLVGLLIKGVKAIGSFLAGLVSNVVGAVTGAFGGMVAAVSSAIGVGVTAASTIVVSGITAVAIGTVGVVGVIVDSNMGKYDDYVGTDCYTKVAEAKEATKDNEDQNAELIANQQKCYSVLKQYGWSDNMIIGMFCAVDGESSGGLSKKIEGDHVSSAKERYEQIGYENAYDKQQEFVNVFCSLKGASVNDNYKGSDGNYYLGHGMLQWTAGRAEKLLRFGKELNKTWYDVDFQIAYLIYEYENGYGAYADYKDSSISECTVGFAKVNTLYAATPSEDVMQKHKSNAEKYTVNESDLASVLEVAKAMGAQADIKAVTEANSKCSKKASNADNSTIAKAAVSYAWETTAKATGNNGTELYQAVHDAVYEGDNVYMSCDRGVACAVKWSGTDLSYPRGSTTVQYNYCSLECDGKWDDLGVYGSSVKLEDLQPGDVAIRPNDVEGYTSGHTWLFVGHDIIAEKYPNLSESYNTVNASLPTRSAGCAQEATHAASLGGQDFHIFRCVRPDNSDEYKDVGIGKSGTS